jgi:hypothetical protein
MTGRIGLNQAVAHRSRRLGARHLVLVAVTCIASHKGE